MRDFFSIGEVAKYTGLSRQALIFYDKIGLFKPACVNPQNGYRLYSAKQLDLLDTILIMRRIGLPLEDIKEYLEERGAKYSRSFLERQMAVIDEQIRFLTLMRSRIAHKCLALDVVASHMDEAAEGEVIQTQTPEQYIFTEPVPEPCTLTEISLATKKCISQAFERELPVFFETGVIVPRDRLMAGEYVRASHAFLPVEYVEEEPRILRLPAGECVICYYMGEYLKIGAAYEKIFSWCRENGLRIISDSYEFCIHDHLTAKREEEYITKILFYVANDEEAIN